MPPILTVDSAANPNWSGVSLVEDEMNKTAWFWTAFGVAFAALFLLTHDEILVGGIMLLTCGIYLTTDALKHPLQRE